MPAKPARPPPQPSSPFRPHAALCGRSTVATKGAVPEENRAAQGTGRRGAQRGRRGCWCPMRAPRSTMRLAFLGRPPPLLPRGSDTASGFGRPLPPQATAPARQMARSRKIPRSREPADLELRSPDLCGPSRPHSRRPTVSQGSAARSPVASKPCSRPGVVRKAGRKIPAGRPCAQMVVTVFGRLTVSLRGRFPCRICGLLCPLSNRPLR